MQGLQLSPGLTIVIHLSKQVQWHQRQLWGDSNPYFPCKGERCKDVTVICNVPTSLMHAIASGSLPMNSAGCSGIRYFKSEENVSFCEFLRHCIVLGHEHSHNPSAGWRFISSEKVRVRPKPMSYSQSGECHVSLNSLFPLTQLRISNFTKRSLFHASLSQSCFRHSFNFVYRKAFITKTDAVTLLGAAPGRTDEALRSTSILLSKHLRPGTQHYVMWWLDICTMHSYE